jgi:trehalose synthase
MITSVPVAPMPPERFRDLLGARYAEVTEAIARAGGLFGDRVIWHVNSTAKGGGVAELLQSLLAYARGAGVDTRWVVIDGDPAFFEVTKRLHNQLHGAPGDGRDLSTADHEAYDRVSHAAAAAFSPMVKPGDIVFCHDPQTAGLVGPLTDAGARVVWRCHIGVDEPNDLSRRAAAFLVPYVRPAAAYVFSREAFVLDGLDRGRVWIVPPSIDVFSPKNQDLAPGTVESILGVIGLGEPGGADTSFTRFDGSTGTVERSAEIDQDTLLPGAAPVVTQVSRWDRLKDPAGVVTGFAEHLGHPDAHLVVAGPATDGVSDDPEGAAVLAEARALRESLPASVRARVHLACLPMADVEENAAMVNAIQRRADIIVQKSLAEGFGLTITEAMWKSRPVVASRRGAIQDMITHGVSGVLLDDPSDLREYAAAVAGLLDDPDRAARIGAAAHERVLEEFLGSRHLVQYLRLLDGLLSNGR